jgi:hypothetical protein
MKVIVLCCAITGMIGSLLAEQVRPPGDVVIYVPFGLRCCPPWTVCDADIKGLSLELIPNDLEMGKAVPILVEGRLQAGVSYSAAFGTVHESTNGVSLGFRISDWQMRLGGCTSVVLQASVSRYLLGENREVIGYVKPGVYQARGTVAAFQAGVSEKQYACIWATNWPAVELRYKLVYYTTTHRLRADRDVIYEKLPEDEDIMMNERVTILWYLDADWLTGLLYTAAENAPDDSRWMRYRDMNDAPSRLSTVWDHLIARPPTCDTVVREGPVHDSFEVTTTRAAAEEYPTIFCPENGSRIVFGPWWESKRTYPSIIKVGESGSSLGQSGSSRGNRGQP